jgi:DNA-binding SARP family transcriptional activator
MIACRTLGPVGLQVDGAPPPPELLWRKHLALLVYLARSPRRTRSREHLVALLWSEKAESAARHSLNEALRVIRRAAGEGAVETRVDQVMLSPEAVELDVDQFEQAMAGADIEEAGGLILGEFMEGFAIPEASSFEDWLASERRHWAGRGVHALVELGGRQADAGRLEEARGTLERALALDPLSESAMHAMMRVLALSGDRAAALDRYDHWCTLLRDRLGSDPGAEVRRLADRIRQDRGPRAPVRPEAEDGPSKRRAPVVGRDGELRAMLEQWVACRAQKKPHVILVSGDQGSGKSRLSEELVQRARLEGAAVSLVRSVPADRDTAGAGLTALAGGGLLEATGLPGTPAAALATFARQLTPWAERFPGVLNESPQPPLRALVEVIRVVGEEQPALLWVDDAQWLDDESLAGLGALVRDLSSTPLLLLITCVPQPPREPLDQLRARVGRELPGMALSLAPLGVSEIRQLVTWAFPEYAEVEAERLARRLAMDSAGLPLLVVELLDAVASGMELHGRAGAWPQPFQTLDQSLPGQLPDAVVAAVRVSFRRLSPGAQRVLAAAAVLEDRVAADRLVRVLELPRAEVHEALDELEWSRWLVAESRGYAFVARITREIVAQDMLTPGQRRRILEAVRPAP